MIKSNNQKVAVDGSMQLANDYKYINAKGGQVGVSAIEAEGGEKFIVVHVADTQFHPEASESSTGTKLVLCALASLELDMGSAKTLHALLGQMIDPPQKG